MSFLGNGHQPRSSTTMQSSQLLLLAAGCFSHQEDMLGCTACVSAAQHKLPVLLRDWRLCLPQPEVTKHARVCRQLHFLEAVILESMRLLPPAYLVGRCTTTALQLKGHTVPQGEWPITILPANTECPAGIQLLSTFQCKTAKNAPHTPTGYPAFPILLFLGGFFVILRWCVWSSLYFLFLLSEGQLAEQSGCRNHAACQPLSDASRRAQMDSLP